MAVYWQPEEGEPLAGYQRLAVAPPPGRYGFWLLGVLLVGLLLWQWPAANRSLLSPATQLRLSLVAAPAPQPAPVPQATPVARAESQPESQPESEPLRAAAPRSGQAEPVAASQPVVNLRASRAALLQDYRPTSPEPGGVTANGATVMDPRLRDQLTATAAAGPSAEPEAGHLPDSLGLTRVDIGGHCFMTSSMDDQALRGMKNWWVGLCGTPEKPAISLKGVKLPGAD